MDDDVYTLLLDLPPRVRGFSRRNEDLTYTIVLNSCLCKEVQQETYLHEIEHIKNGDFQETTVGSIEAIRHKG